MSKLNTIEQFYLGQIADNCGRRIEEIWAWNDERLESVHDCIQWLFPSRRPSDFNPDAPLLTEMDIARFRKSSILQERLLTSLHRMLRFYGFQCADRKNPIVIERASNWTERSAVWLAPGNHNYLRITRILACLRTLGLPVCAQAFLEALETVERDYPGKISGRTLTFWRTAAG